MSADTRHAFNMLSVNIVIRLTENEKVEEARTVREQKLRQTRSYNECVNHFLLFPEQRRKS